MKILIIYSTKWGVSKACAQMLADRLTPSFDITVCDIQDTPPSPEAFDVAVIGGSIRMGKLNKKLKEYLKAHADLLNTRHAALFLCCGFTENFDDYARMQFPKNISADLGVHFFGGELKPQKLTGVDRILVKMLRSEVLRDDFEAPDPDISPLPEIIPENIFRLADSIRGLL